MRRMSCRQEKYKKIREEDKIDEIKEQDKRR